MTILRGMRSIPTDVLLRAFAISGIVLNHAHRGGVDFPLGLAGGMTFLLTLAGMNLARFGVKGATPDSLRRAIGRLALALFVPALIAVLAYLAIRRTFSWTEVLFIRNWVSPFHHAMFPEWYVQVFLQILLGLLLLAYIPAVSRAVVRRPLRSMLMLFTVALVIRAVGPSLWNTQHLMHKLPHMHLWNFALGGVIFFCGRDAQGDRAWMLRMLTIVCVVAGAEVAWSPSRLEYWYLIIGGTLLVLTRDVKVPRLLAQAAVILSAASYAIFLTHYFWFKIFRLAYRHVFQVDPHALLVFLVGLGFGTAVWIALTSFGRAYRAATAGAALRPGPGAVLISSSSR